MRYFPREHNAADAATGEGQRPPTRIERGIPAIRERLWLAIVDVPVAKGESRRTAPRAVRRLLTPT
ncbi:MAG TPA: hypothetical protein VEI52_27575 [Terriglobales bacterium]|nr:hypothetical protein [Terriglobales bacterium]